MRLRNKKTDEIVDYISFEKGGGGQITMYVFDTNKHYYYNSLAELNEEWEDYEEPKGTALYWTILTLQNFIENEPDDRWVDLEDCKQMLEKLKAWRRLEEKGFRFVNNSLDICCHTINFKVDTQFDMTDETSRDLHLIFGGEESGKE